MCAFNFCVSTLNVIASFRIRKPPKFLSTLDGSVSPICILKGLSSPLEVWLFAYASSSISASGISTSRCCVDVHRPRSSIMGSNLVPPPYRIFSAKVSIDLPFLRYRYSIYDLQSMHCCSYSVHYRSYLNML